MVDEELSVVETDFVVSWFVDWVIWLEVVAMYESSMKCV